MQVVTLELPELGNRCHLVHDGTPGAGRRPAARPDRRSSGPPRRRGSRSRRSRTPTSTTTTCRVPSAWRAGTAPTTCSRPTSRSSSSGSGVRDGDVVGVGGLDVRVIATPGHTRHHQAFLARPRDAGDGTRARCSAAAACCTAPSGGPTCSATCSRDDLARAQWASARALGALDPDPAAPHPRVRQLLRQRLSVEPGDGPTRPSATERAVNPALLLDREPFVDGAGRGLRAGPLLLRAHGPAQPGRRRPPAPAPGAGRSPRDEVHDAMADGAWVVDLRGRGPVRRGPPGRHGQRRVLATSSRRTSGGWCRGRPSSCCSPTGRPTSAPALRDLAGIGIDGVGTHVLDPAAAAARDLPARRTGPASAPATRAGSSSTSGSATSSTAGHLPGAVHLPVHEVEQRRGRRCPRASCGCTAAPATAPASPPACCTAPGRSVVHVDDDWARGRRAGDPHDQGRHRGLTTSAVHH